MLGIFQGKKAKNNKLILKSLATGSKTTKQIAEYVYLNRKNTMKPLKLDNNEVKKIVSIISRKGSRLDELKAKHYISRKNNLLQLTIKGACVALTQFNNIMEVYPLLQVNSIVNAFAKEFHKHPTTRMLLKSSSVKKEEIDKALAFGKSPKIPQLFKDYTNELIKQGVNLDKMPDSELALLMISKGISYFLETQTSELIKALSKNLNNNTKT